MNDDQELKHISIRGVNADVYETFSNKVKELDLTIGEAITKIMEDVVVDFDETFPDISATSLKSIAAMNKGRLQHQNKITVSRNDLIEADMRFRFEHINHLEFTPDVDQETFEKYVISIQHCTKVRIPNILPKLKLLAFVKHCSDVEFYEVE